MVANTADDIWVHGLKVCPDLDTVMYTLGDGIDLERGWGRRDETWSVKEELAAYGVEPTWFGLGDRDVATHLVRTQMLDAGYPLSAGDRGPVPALARARLGGRHAAADDRRPGRDPRRDRRRRTPPAGAGSSTSRSTGSGCAPQVPAEAVVVVGLDEADARARASSTRSPTPTWCSLPPSNPVVSVGTILGVPRVREALVATQGAGRRPLPHHRRHPRARHGRADAHLDRRRGQRRRRRAALRRPLGRRRARRLAGRHRRTPATSTGCTRPGWPRPPYPC